MALASVEPELCALPPDPDVVPDDSAPTPTSTPTLASTVASVPAPPTLTVPCVAEFTVPSTLRAAAGRAKPSERTTHEAVAMVLRMMFIFLLDYLVMAYFGHISDVAEKPSCIKTNHHERTYRRRRASEVRKQALSHFRAEESETGLLAGLHSMFEDLRFRANLPAVAICIC